MAPFVPSSDVSDLEISSLELDARSTSLDDLISRALPVNLLKRDATSLVSSPTEVYKTLSARDGGSVRTPDHGGAVDPTSINMKGIQALFAIISASFVVAAIWFFFWAKNGGFQWRRGDWDDYKSTVLRRKGPNGTTLSNATKSTRLGGGSVVGEGYSDGTASTTDDTRTETMTELSSEAPIMREKRNKRETAKERKVREAREAGWEGANDEDVVAYMYEKPARVGGINKDSEALHYGTDYTDTEGSQAHSHSQGRAPGRAHMPRGASRSRQPSPEKRQTRRDFSYGNDEAFSTVSSSHHPHEEIPAPPLQQYAAPPMQQYTAPPMQQHQPLQYHEAPPPTPPHRPGRYHSPNKQINQNQNQSDARRAAAVAAHIHAPPRIVQPSGSYEPSVVSDMQSQYTKSYHHPLPSLAGQGPRQSQNQSPARGYRRDRRDSLDD